jgi:signal transduction histidine kinase
LRRDHFSPKIENAHLKADPVALKRLFGNLVDDTLAHGSRCDVALAGDGARPVVTVDDDGPGIPPDEREAVFEPFFRLDRARNRDSGGSRLDLAIARQVVEGHGGAHRDRVIAARWNARASEFASFLSMPSNSAVASGGCCAAQWNLFA